MYNFQDIALLVVLLVLIVSLYKIYRTNFKKQKAKSKPSSSQYELLARYVIPTEAIQKTMESTGLDYRDMKQVIYNFKNYVAAMINNDSPIPVSSKNVYELWCNFTLDVDNYENFCNQFNLNPYATPEFKDHEQLSEEELSLCSKKINESYDLFPSYYKNDMHRSRTKYINHKLHGCDIVPADKFILKPDSFFKDNWFWLIAFDNITCKSTAHTENNEDFSASNSLQQKAE